MPDGCPHPQLFLAKSQAEPFELLRTKTPDEREARTRRSPGSDEDGVARSSCCALAILAKRFESGRDGRGATRNEKSRPGAKHHFESEGARATDLKGAGARKKSRATKCELVNNMMMMIAIISIIINIAFTIAVAFLAPTVCAAGSSLCSSF